MEAALGDFQPLVLAGARDAIDQPVGMVDAP